MYYSCGSTCYQKLDFIVGRLPTCEHRCMRTQADARTQAHVQCMGRHNLKTRTDVTFIQRLSGCNGGLSFLSTQTMKLTTLYTNTAVTRGKHHNGLQRDLGACGLCNDLWAYCG